MPFTSEMCTRDIDYQKVMDSDKREHRFATSKLLFGIAIAQARAYLLKGKLKIPVLFLIAGEDKLVDPGASTNVFKGLKAKDLSRILSTACSPCTVFAVATRISTSVLALVVFQYCGTDLWRISRVLIQDQVRRKRVRVYVPPFFVGNLVCRIQDCRIDM